MRSSVDLPEPLAPMSATTSCSATARSMPRSTSVSPNALRTPASSSTFTAARPSAPLPQPRGPPVREPDHRDGEQHEEQAGYDVRREIEGVRDLDLGRPHRIHGPEHRDQSDVLLHRDEIVHECRRHLAHGLREYDEPQRLPVVEPE